MAIDQSLIRDAIAGLEASAAHSASGENRPRADEIFAPAQHAGALDPNTTIVLGSRGAGKSFWAGVLGDRSTRLAVAPSYPDLNLDNIDVLFGFTGVENDGSVSKATINANVPHGRERELGLLLWRCVVLRAMLEVSGRERQTIKTMMQEFSDPEEWEESCARVDRELAAERKNVLVVFDALDGLAEEWPRLRDLIDSLLEVAWSIKGYKSIRMKLFLRPDQMRDLGLRFVELPKLIAGSTNLWWTGANLYGMFYTRLYNSMGNSTKREFNKVLSSVGLSPPPSSSRRWSLTSSRVRQAQVFSRIAGLYMGRTNKKGRTYDWPLNHLADGHGEVTPRSFLTLLIAAGRSSPSSKAQAITAEGLRNGLREASKVRLDQLALEFPWIKRVLAPLSRMQVPCDPEIIISRWEDTATVPSIMSKAVDGEFLPPFDPRAEGTDEAKLITSLVRIGVLAIRPDGRFDMPDLFRVAARLLRKGGVAPTL